VLQSLDAGLAAERESQSGAAGDSVMLMMVSSDREVCVRASVRCTF